MPKLNLRDLFWLMLVAGILCAWWIDHDKQAQWIDKQARQIEEISEMIPMQDPAWPDAR